LVNCRLQNLQINCFLGRGAFAGATIAVVDAADEFVNRSLSALLGAAFEAIPFLAQFRATPVAMAGWLETLDVGESWPMIS
jgi:hypothetical protein